MRQAFSNGSVRCFCIIIGRRFGRSLNFRIVVLIRIILGDGRKDDTDHGGNDAQPDQNSPDQIKLFTFLIHIQSPNTAGRTTVRPDYYYSSSSSFLASSITFC